MLLGCALLIGGLAVTVVSIADSDGWLLFVGSVISGAGFGSTFLGAFRTLAAAASPARRGELIAALYVVAYLAFSLPAVAAGVLTTHLGLRDTTICYATVVAALAIGSLSAARIRTHPATA